MTKEHADIDRFDGDRLQVLRLYRSLSLVELAVKCGINQGRLWRFEHDQDFPTLDELHTLEGALGVKRRWLCPTSKSIPMDVFWHGRPSHEDALYAVAQVIALWVRSKITFEKEFRASTKIDLEMRYGPCVDPEIAAMFVRHEALVGASRGITKGSVSKLMESSGVVLLGGGPSCDEGGGIAFWADDGVPVICVDVAQSAPRFRFDIMSALGWFVLSNPSPEGCAQFARHVLFSREAAVPCKGRGISLQKIVDRYGLPSAEALNVLKGVGDERQVEVVQDTQINEERSVVLQRLSHRMGGVGRVLEGMARDTGLSVDMIDPFIRPLVSPKVTTLRSETARRKVVA